jgi:hypothetical protein
VVRTRKGLRGWFRDLGHGHQATLVGTLVAALIGCAGTVVVAILTNSPSSDGAPSEEDPGRGQTYTAAQPGCEAESAQAHWTTAMSTLDCGRTGSVLAKSYPSTGNIGDNNGELRFRRGGQQFPSSYQLSVTVRQLNDRDPTSAGACAGFSTHADPEGRTFEELSVCSNGVYALIRSVNGREIGRDEGQLPVTGTYNLRADVSPSTVTFTVNNGQGVAGRLTSSAVSPTTEYVALTVFWKGAGATAEFADFQYQG